jgi:tRNA(fMet)-specific endonuclease VapC
MIKAMLDTNILIYLSKNDPPAVMERLAKFRKGEIGISSIAWGEYLVGLYKKGITDGQFDQFISVIPFDVPAANIFAKLTAKYPDRTKGFDRLIAAHAIAVGVKLVTNNTADFALYLDDGLAVENWV